MPARWAVVLVLLAGGCSALQPAPSLPPVPDPGLPQIQQGVPAPAPWLMQYSPPTTGPAPIGVLANPLRVPVADRDFAWEQLIAVVEEYFKIQHEDRVRLAGDILTEGRIASYPLIAATLLEPWRGDSVGFQERLQCTTQSKRRTCFVRVIPEAASFLIEVNVHRELEDLPQPLMSPTSAGLFPFQTDYTNGVGRGAGDVLPSLGEAPGFQPHAGPRVVNWIDEGRDVKLEQVMLAEIQARLAVAVGPAYVAPTGVPVGPAY
jgi:hypothetical protein